MENVRYGQQIKKRLGQIEKGLQHSSADTAALTYVLGVYKDLFGDFSMLGSESVLPAGTKEKAEAIWTSFMNGEKLTDSKTVQSLIDQAHMPEKGSRVHI